MAIPYSLLDLAPISEGFGVKDALNNSTLMAKEAERSGYERVWLAEHHGMQGVASSATSVVLTHIANATSTIKVGAGGIMLPNHSPLVIAEQFGTLAELFPNRIELGLGRAPGTDMATARALRRNLQSDVDSYPEDIRELQHYLGELLLARRVYEAVFVLSPPSARISFSHNRRSAVTVTGRQTNHSSLNTS